MKSCSLCILMILFLFTSCAQNEKEKTESIKSSLNKTHIDKKSGYQIICDTGSIIYTRFLPPEGFERIKYEENSFRHYLQHLPLKPHGEKVTYFDGSVKHKNVYDAVVDMEISKNDLQQCADAVMRLKGEFLFQQKAFNEISFTLTNGFKMDYSEWIKGNRLAINGNKTYWKKTTSESNTYKDFRAFMDIVFSYAGTLSLSKSLTEKNINDIECGDIFIQGGSPGHAVIVVDMATNKNGEKVFLLAQSYMPAQETQILKNFNDPSISPWYSVNFHEKLKTPEWVFSKNHLKTW